MGYVQKVFKLRSLFDQCADNRKRAEVPAPTVARCAFILTMVRCGSLNAWESSKRGRQLRKWLGSEGFSADTFGRVMDRISPDQLRKVIVAVHHRMKRNKVLLSRGLGRTMLIVDGHESHCSELQKCPGCLQRTIKRGGKEVIQYYHRYAAAQLVSGRVHSLLDLEPQRPGENEVAASTRLIERVNARFGNLFDLVLADALYVDGPFWKFVRALGKHVIVVLKNEHRTLMEDARSLFTRMNPIVTRGNRSWSIKDAEGFLTWPQAGEAVRVVQSIETETVRRQVDKRLTARTSEWMWVTSLPQADVSTVRLVDLAHTRWTIENQGFNEVVNAWKADHVYKHAETAYINFILVTFLALAIFQVFFLRNLKPARRRSLRRQHLARLLSAEYYAADLAGDTS